MNSITLSELTARIEETIKLDFSKPVWIRAEISELRENSGHCYMELIEKPGEQDNITAKCRATCWASVYRMIRPYFESTTGQTLTAGLQILVAVTVEFHPVYGLNLNVRDIDPVFTVGEMAAKRQQIIKRLEADGIADMNKLLEIPQTAQRIAVISSPTAAGYEDFLNQLRNNIHGYRFYFRLFPAIMQGDGAEQSIVKALDTIFGQMEMFDTVVIIRGGGATADLACFDSYTLALNCAQFPLPVISGIGHQRDVSILDMVAHTSVKTPTAAAELLINNLCQAENQLNYIYSDIEYILGNRLNYEEERIQKAELRLKHGIENAVRRNFYKLDSAETSLRKSIQMLIMKEHSRLQILEQQIESYSPAFLLKHGYTITTVNGKRIFSVSEVPENSNIRTFSADGYFDSKICSTHTKEK